jgi:hypothetical protein
MNLKKTLVVLVLLAGSAITVFAHDRGDLMLNIEPQIGMAFPDIVIRDRATGIKDKDIPGVNTFSIGMDAGLRGTVHYYFWDFFSFNSGLGFNVFAGGHYAIYTENEMEDMISYESTLTDSNILFFGYFTIPVGFRFSLGVFTAGAGLTGNLPIGGISTYQTDIKETFQDNTGLSASRNRSSDKIEDDRFKMESYLGWYFDLGFDLSGRKGKKGGYGMLARVAGSFSNKIAKTDNKEIEYNPFRYFAVSIVFQAGIELANIPIDDKLR